MPILGTIASSYLQGTGSFESIQTASVGSGGQTTITFSSIPSTYKHLRLHFFLRSNNAPATDDATYMTFNSDTGANYRRHAAYGVGTGTLTGSGNGAPYTFMSVCSAPSAGTTAGFFSGGILDILDYANTNKTKVVHGLSGFGYSASPNLTMFHSGMWNSTSAINRIDLQINGGSNNFAQYSRIALYGIKGA